MLGNVPQPKDHLTEHPNNKQPFALPLSARRELAMAFPLSVVPPRPMGILRWILLCGKFLSNSPAREHTGRRSSELETLGWWRHTSMPSSQGTPPGSPWRNSFVARGRRATGSVIRCLKPKSSGISAQSPRGGSGRDRLTADMTGREGFRSLPEAVGPWD